MPTSSWPRPRARRWVNILLQVEDHRQLYAQGSRQQPGGERLRWQAPDRLERRVVEQPMERQGGDGDAGDRAVRANEDLHQHGPFETAPPGRRLIPERLL